MEELQKTALLQKILREVEGAFRGIDDLAHGWEHVQRVYHLALKLAEEEQADPFIVGLAALLHDLGRAAPANQHSVHHADLSIEMAHKLLQRYGIDEQTQAAVAHAILAHSFSRGIEPQSREARVVRDADRLDGLGAIGILRWALTGAVRRTSDTVSYHPSDPFGEAHELDDTRYMLDHFYRKLLTMENSMLTTSGRRMARERTAFMRSYLDEFRHELALLS